VRGLSQALHPSLLEEVGLERTIEWYLSTLERQLDVAVSYELSGTPSVIDSAIGIHVYRVLQEALNNVARHSGSRQAWVRLRFEARMLELDVEDHGKGLGKPRSRRGLGLVAMRERAALVGGTLEFVRPREGGTLVRLRVPLEPLERVEPLEPLEPTTARPSHGG
jgi:signal transduction histidine kinase